MTVVYKKYKVKIDQLTKERLKTSKSHWGGTYLHCLFLKIHGE